MSRDLEDHAGARATNPVYVDKPTGTSSSILKKRWWLIAALAVLSIVAISFVFWGMSQRKQERAAQVAAVANRPPPAVVGLGFLEPSSTVVTVGAPGSGDSQRIASLNVIEGQEVEQNQTIAVMDTAEKLQAQVRSAQAQIDLKRVMLQKQRLDMVSTIASRRAAVNRARADFEVTQAELKRQEDLVAQGFTSPSTLQGKRREFLNAQATLDEAIAALQRAETTVAPASGARKSGAAAGEFIDVAVTERDLAAAEADLLVARANLDQAVIRAPFKGRIISIKAYPGERVGSDGVVEIGSTNKMRAVIEVYQTDIDRVRVGQAVALRADALNDMYMGKVDRIGIAVKRQTVVNNDPATATDARVVEVFVSLDDDTSRKLSTYSRLQVLAKFQ